MNKLIRISLIIGILSTSLVVQADIVKDIQSGILPQQVIQQALNAGLAAPNIAIQLINAGVNPITSAGLVTRALPSEAVNIAVAAVVTKVSVCQTIKSPEKLLICLAEASQIAVGIADTVVEEAPDKKDDIINAVAKVAPDPTVVIATFYHEPDVVKSHNALTQETESVTRPSSTPSSATFNSKSISSN